MRKRVVISSISIAAIVVAVSLCYRPSEPVASAVLLPYPYVAKPSLAAKIEAWIPRSWSWVWRIRDKFRGPELDLSILVVQRDDSDLKKPDVISPDGTRVWRLTAEEMSSFPRKGEHLSAILMSLGLFTRDGIEGQLMSTSSMPGSTSNHFSYTARLYPTVRGRNIDVFAEVAAQETMPNGVFVTTNLMTAARLQFTNGCGYLILAPTNGSERDYGALVAANFAKPKVKTTKRAAKSKSSSP